MVGPHPRTLHWYFAEVLSEREGIPAPAHRVTVTGSIRVGIDVRQNNTA